MTLNGELTDYAKRTFREHWTIRDGHKVPDSATPNISMGNDGVKIFATVLYADLADSTRLVEKYTAPFAAEIYKTYLYGAGKIIRSLGGSITAYDGDRIMAVFIGNDKNSKAVKAALRINFAVAKIITPALEAQYPKTSFGLSQKVGVDTSQLMVTRTGIRGSNDLVWVGNAANRAAKMSAVSGEYSSYISSATYSVLADWAKLGGNPTRNMWTNLGSSILGFPIYGSNWHWSF